MPEKVPLIICAQISLQKERDRKLYVKPGFPLFF